MPAFMIKASFDQKSLIFSSINMKKLAVVGKSEEKLFIAVHCFLVFVTMCHFWR